MMFLYDLVNYLYEDSQPESVKLFLQEQYAKTIDQNKGFFWEKVLEKKMKEHTKLLGGRTVGRDFEDNTDAKFSTFYKKDHGLGDWQASVSNIRSKIGPLRVCLCVPGDRLHRVHFLFIPREAVIPYLEGSDALKFGLGPGGMPTSKLMKYACSFNEVSKPFQVATQKRQLVCN